MFNKKRARRLDFENIIILPYFDQWQWMFGIEIALLLASKGKKVLILKLTIVDKSILKRILKGVFGYSQVTRKVLKDIESRGVVLKRDWAFPFMRRPRIIFDSNGEFSLADLHQEIAFPHIVNDVLTTKLDNRKFKRTIQKHIRDVKITQEQLQKYEFPKLATIYTINGRFSKNRTIKYFFDKRAGFKIKILESASSGKYEILDDAQSMTEWQDKIASHWNESKDPSKIQISENFFIERTRRIMAAEDVWTSRMKQGAIPNLDPTKKVCTFYSTTEIEFVGGGGNRPLGEIGSQIEAIQLLRTKLPSDEWQLVVRRHPIPRDSEHDLDETLTRKLQEVPNLIEISGDSKVDSYALADRSDLVTHYGSSIGAELVYRGKTPVYALGRTPWQYFDPEHHLIAKEDIDKLDLNNLKRSEKATVFPWSYYQLTGGREFSYLKLSDKFGWTLNGTPINVKFSSWISIKYWYHYFEKQSGTEHG